MEKKKIKFKLKKKIKKSKIEIFADKIEIVPIDSIKLDKNNPRKNDKNVNKLANILKIHGQRTPITVCADTKIIYKGNTTYKAMQRIGATHIAVTFQKFENDSKRIKKSGL